ncbi:MAG TPA: PKD domain-containing protein, partial [Bacteroidia bacterium]|nr:PKD domain-containing protein [Bacteroidia bacterium]
YTVTGTSTTATCPGNPDASATVTVKLKPIVIVNDLTICRGESAKLTGQILGGATTGKWIGGMGKFVPNRNALNATYTPTVEEQDSTKITLTLESEDPEGPCGKESKSMVINVIPAVTSDAGPDQTICEGESVTLNGVFGGAATQGRWTNGTGTFTPSANSPTAQYKPSVTEEKNGKAVLRFEVTNGSNATCPGGIDEMIINIDKMPTVSAGADQFICFDKEAKLVGSIGGSAKTATWKDGQGVFTKDNKTLDATYKPSASEIAAGSVTLTLVTDPFGKCPTKESKTTIYIYPEPKVVFTVDTPKACPPHCVNFTDSSFVAGSDVTKWFWNFGKDTSTKQHPSICFPLSGFYDVSLTATSDKGCSATLKKDQYIETYKVPKADFIANPWEVSKYDPTIQFHDRSSSDVISWKWDLGDGKIVSPKNRDPRHQYEVGVSAVYNVKLFVVNNNGCVDSTMHPVEVLPEFAFYIPNAFTPNRVDGTNDTFYGKGVGIVSYHLWIFDRWGNMVFNSPDIDAGWDGRANNGEAVAQQDVYVWKVKLTDIFGKRHDYIGTVTLVR